MSLRNRLDRLERHDIARLTAAPPRDAAWDRAVRDPIWRARMGEFFDSVIDGVVPMNVVHKRVNELAREIDATPIDEESR
jgi:hypothetical protein